MEASEPILYGVKSLRLEGLQSVDNIKKTLQENISEISRKLTTKFTVN